MKPIGEEVLYLSVGELGELIRTRQLSPVDLLEGYLERSQRLNPKLNAYATLTKERAYQRARAAEAEIAAGKYRGPLHGIPYAAKDLAAVKGYPTTWGAKPYANQHFEADAWVIRKLDEAGAVLMGKAAMIELAGGLGYEHGSASLTGAARNPWNTDCWTCGSSSGSGAVVAAALAAFALGSDTRGSIICPSSWCGVSGMRPSFGRVGRSGCMTISWTMDKIGPMCRSAQDCGLVLAAISGHDPDDPDSLPSEAAGFRYREGGGVKGLRIGRLTNILNHPDVALESAVDESVRVLEKQGAKVYDAKIPDGPYEEVAELTILIEAAAAFAELIHSGKCAELASPLGRINGYVSEEISGADYLRAQRVRKVLRERISLMFEQFDVLVASGEGSVAQPLSDPPEEESTDEPLERRAPDGISSLFGLPAVAVPCGFSKTKLPFSVQFLAQAQADQTALNAATVFQSNTDWHRQSPKL